MKMLSARMLPVHDEKKRRSKKSAKKEKKQRVESSESSDGEDNTSNDSASLSDEPIRRKKKREATPQEEARVPKGTVVTIPGFHVEQFDRVVRRNPLSRETTSGGLLTFVRDSLRYSRVAITSDPDDATERLDIQLHLPDGATLRVVNIYRPPIPVFSKVDTRKNLFDPNSLPTIDAVIAGDFNLHHPLWEDGAASPNSLSSSMAEWILSSDLSEAKMESLSTSAADLSRFSKLTDVYNLLGRLDGRVVESEIPPLEIDGRLVYDDKAGFLRGRTAEEQIAAVQSSLYEARDNGKRSVLLLFDIRKAFDTVDKNKLMDQLKVKGVSGRMLNWIAKFLRGRRAAAKVNGTLGTMHDIVNGVPQGTVLAPSLFLCYIDPLAEKLQEEFPDIVMSLFADDLAVTSSHKICYPRRCTTQYWRTRAHEGVVKAGLDDVPAQVLHAPLVSPICSDESVTIQPTIPGVSKKNSATVNKALTLDHLGDLRGYHFLAATDGSKAKGTPTGSACYLSCRKGFTQSAVDALPALKVGKWK
eukprot:gene18150-27958_t